MTIRVSKAASPQISTIAPAAPLAAKAVAAPQAAVSEFVTAPAVEPLVLKQPATAAKPVSLDTPEGKQAISAAQSDMGRRFGAIAGFDPAVDLRPKSIEKDVLGFTHVRMDRMHEGLPVFGEQVIAHLDAKGVAQEQTGEVREIPAGLATTQPIISAGDALGAAMKEFARQPDQAPSVEKLIAKDDDGNYRLAYQVVLPLMAASDSPPVQMNYMVDAKTGEVFVRWNALGGFNFKKNDQRLQGAPTIAAVLAGKGNDTSMYSGMVELTATQGASGWELNDSTRGQGVETRDAMNLPMPFFTTEITDQDNVWGPNDGERIPAAVDAHYGASMTYDFYKNVMGRNSIDGNGEKIVSNIHIGNDYVNAFWNGQNMNYGDGDGQQASSLTTLDVAGHEITHGLTQRTANLTYRDESGAINEAMSDILGGVGVEWYAAKQNSNVKWDYDIGEDCWTPATAGDALRYMYDPTKDGRSKDNYSTRYQGTDDNGGVHLNSGIVNNAFYLLAEGGKNRTSGQTVNKGIGVEKSLQIYFRALTTYMTAETTMAQAKEACARAASDLFGASSAEVNTVRQAWGAVGV